MNARLTIVCTLGLLACVAAAPAPPPVSPPDSSSPPSTQKYVTVEQYQAVLQNEAAMKKELEEVKKEQATDRANAEQDDKDIDAEIKTVQADADANRGGLEDLVIAGDASFAYTATRGAPSTFSAGVAPLFLWSPDPNLLIEAAFDVGIDTDQTNASSTSFDLTLANASYIVNDWLLVGAGLFDAPFGAFHNHFDPPWIYFFPDSPLVYGDRAIAPEHLVGAYAEGAIPFADSKFTYQVYLSNGPDLIVNDPGAAGSLNYDEFTDQNNDKAIGGRFAYLPTPNIEIGYSVQASRVNPQGFQSAHAFLQAVDFNWKQDCDQLGGTVHVMAEYISNDVSTVTYDPDSSMNFGPLRYHNHRDGGYVQGSFRFTKAGNDLLKNVEVGLRYDSLNIPMAAPGGGHQQRWTAGVNYWVTPYNVLQLAYEWDLEPRGTPEQNTIIFQWGIGL